MDFTALPFPPLTTSHILNCSYHSWHPRYRNITPKARLVPLPQPFVDYLRADGIILPPDDNAPQTEWSDSDSGIFSSTEDAAGNEDEDEDEDPSAHWRETHQTIKSTIAVLGGNIVPKLNWSAPKDATWIAATNSMECRNPNDVYLLLKSSDFIAHDLEHAFDDCIDAEADEDDEDQEDASETASQTTTRTAHIPYHLVLRKHVQLNPSLEFRCFVRNRKLIALCQRDLNHFDFLFKMQDRLRAQIQLFFDLRLRDTFPDPSFAFDVYIPPPHDRVWLVDVNPWAQRTDPLLFSWMELLTMPEPDIAPETTVSLPLRPKANSDTNGYLPTTFRHRPSPLSSCMTAADSSDGEDEEDEEDIFIPEFRLVRSDDPEAYGFATPQYSAHKLPRDVVDASRGGESQMREFAQQWKELVENQEKQAEESEAE